jgi:hypothetical protein
MFPKRATFDAATTTPWPEPEKWTALFETTVPGAKMTTLPLCGSVGADTSFAETTDSTADTWTATGSVGGSGLNVLWLIIAAGPFTLRPISASPRAPNLFLDITTLAVSGVVAMNSCADVIEGTDRCVTATWLFVTTCGPPPLRRIPSAELRTEFESMITPLRQKSTAIPMNEAPSIVFPTIRDPEHEPAPPRPGSSFRWMPPIPRLFERALSATSARSDRWEM